MTRWYSILNSQSLILMWRLQRDLVQLQMEPDRRRSTEDTDRPAVSEVEVRLYWTEDNVITRLHRTERTEGPARWMSHLVTSSASPGSRRRRGAAGSLSVTRGAGRGAVMARVWLDQVGSESCSFSHEHGTKQRSGSTRRCRFGLTRLHRGPKPVQRGSKLVSKPLTISGGG
jgi:hypothetical protein